MSRVYDNWERLVAAVMKREEIRQICHAPSISSNSSINSSVSTNFYPSSSSQFDENLESAKSEVQEWIEIYEPGVAGHRKGSKELKFSWRKMFRGKVAETRLYNSKEKVDKTHKDPNEVISLGRNEVLPLLKTKLAKTNEDPNEVASLGRHKKNHFSNK